MIFRSIITIGLTIGFSMVVSNEDAIDTFLFFGLVFSIMQNLVVYFFIRTTPNLHDFANKVSDGNFDYIFVMSTLAYLQYFEEILIGMIRFLLTFDINYSKIPSPQINVMLI